MKTHLAKPEGTPQDIWELAITLTTDWHGYSMSKNCIAQVYAIAETLLEERQQNLDVLKPFAEAAYHFEDWPENEDSFLWAANATRGQKKARITIKDVRAAKRICDNAGN